MRSPRVNLPCSSSVSVRLRTASPGPRTPPTFPSSHGNLVRPSTPLRLRVLLTRNRFGDTVQEQSQKRPLILISAFIHDVSSFIDEHPGGRHLLVKMIGKDATTAFFGGVYDHSNAAHNVSSLLTSSSPSNNLLTDNDSVSSCFP